MSSTALAVGETFERYEIETLIGRGGMGEVYRAVDTRLRRRVALKVLRPDRDVGGQDHLVARLFREARSAAGLTHPNTVAIHDIGEAEGIFYIVMELVSGASLIHYIGDRRVTLTRKLAWLDQVARALSAAHRAGVIHRDVKPANVMITVDDTVKVLDFGLAKPLAPASFRTAQGHVLGTPRYMAPEQLAGTEVDARSDQYSFGLLAYELLSGTHPGGALMGSIPPPPLEEVSPDVTPLLARVVQRMLAMSPRGRFETMDDVATALIDAAAGRPSIALAALEARDTEVAPETVPTDSETASSTAPTETSPRILVAAPQDPGPGAREKTMRLGAAPQQPPPARAFAGEKTLPAATFAAAIVAEVPSRPPVESTLLSSDRRLPLLPPSSLPPTAPTAPRPPPSAPAPSAKTLPPAFLVAVLVVLAISAFAGAFFGSRALTQHNLANAGVAEASASATSAVVTPPPPPPMTATASEPPPLQASAPTEPLDPHPFPIPRRIHPPSRPSANAAPLPTPSPAPAPLPTKPRPGGDLMDPFGNAR